MQYASLQTVGPFQCMCVKCGSTRRPRVVFRAGPHPHHVRDYLSWSCEECGYSWNTETADFKTSSFSTGPR